MSEAYAPERRTIADAVRAARRRLGVRGLAARAGVPRYVVEGAALGVIAFESAPLRRLLAVSEGVLASQPRPRP